MLKRIFSVILLLSFSIVGFCQTKEIVDREITLIKDIPQNVPYTKQRIKADKHYKTILRLDTSAIPFLIDKITDTTQTEIVNICSGEKFEIGDIAFCLIDSIDLILWKFIDEAQWDVLNCGPEVPLGGWEFINSHRMEVQRRLKSFLNSDKGKKWIMLVKSKKISKTEYDSLVKQIFKAEN